MAEIATAAMAVLQLWHARAPYVDVLCTDCEVERLGVSNGGQTRVRGEREKPEPTKPSVIKQCAWECAWRFCHWRATRPVQSQ
eukprot:458375-Alexandrium_andersonii.AAC.1